jgi:hypothetical protein
MGSSMMDTGPFLPKMERRMAALFLLALLLIAWQALRTKPVGQPPYESVMKRGEWLLPVAVPSWSPPAALPEDPRERLGFLEKRALSWPVEEELEEKDSDCKIFARFSSQHWSVRSASPARVRSWLERPETEGSWRRLRFPVRSFLDDDDGDGDPLDDGELREAGLGADVEVFCGEAARTDGGIR